MDPLTYSNPVMSKIVHGWPYGAQRTTADFQIEVDPKRGERAVRVTVNPKTGKAGATKKLTYAKQMRIVDGSDGKTYIAYLTRYGFVGIMQGNMQFQQESIFDTDPRFPALVALFDLRLRAFDSGLI